eukprot:5247368-Lingulodinium_polyedra.AAC.1
MRNGIVVPGQHDRSRSQWRRKIPELFDAPAERVEKGMSTGGEDVCQGCDEAPGSVSLGRSLRTEDWARVRDSA